MSSPRTLAPWLWIAIAALGGVVVILLGRAVMSPGGEWTTSSRAACVELESGLEAYRQLYVEQAIEHYGRALELDPDFVAAKLELAANLALAQPRRSRQLIREVEEADLTDHTERERFLAGYYIALFRGEPEVALERLDEYLEDHPLDPYVLNIKATLEWQEGDLAEAERLNLRLLEISPDWVLAYNQLGYGAMARGQFTEAEEYFTSYRYIAPDQANPHDSLAELYIVIGRWDDADASLMQAQAVREDFMPAAQHLTLVRSLAEDFAGARRAIESNQSLTHVERAALKCDVLMAELETEGRETELIEEGLECVELRGGFRLGPLASHRVACRIGDWSAAGLLQARVRRMLTRSDLESPVRPGDVRAALAHMEGVRLALRGQLEDAEAVLEAADRSCGFTNAEIGIFKLTNRVLLAEVLLAQGREGEGHRLLNQVESINPALVERFQLNQISWLGLGRYRDRERK